MDGFLPIVMDNPVLIKHMRSRLRVGQVVPWAVVVFVLCICITYGGFVTRSIGGGAPLGFLIALQVFLLAMTGASQIGNAVGGARESGIMDAHRVSPQPPLATAVGFFLGAPIREYLLTAITIPFAFFLALATAAGIGGWLVLEVGVLLGSWVLHALTMMSTMMSKRPRSMGRGTIGALILLSIFFGPSTLFGIFGASQFFSQNGGDMIVFGARMPWVLFLIVYLLPVLVVLFIPSVRRCRSDRDHPFTKRQAIVCQAVLAALTVGVSWSMRNLDYAVIGVVYVLAAMACVFSLTIAPTRSEYLRGLRGAAHVGRKRPSPWSDEGASWQGTLVLALLAVVGATVAWSIIAPGSPERSKYSLSIAVGALVALYMGFGQQFFYLRYPKRAGSLMALLIFFAWFLPLIAGALAGSAGADDEAMPILAFSPICGIALATPDVGGLNDSAERMAAVVPAAILAGMFFILIDLTQRQLDQDVKPFARPKEESPWTDEELAALGSERSKS